MAWKFAMDLKNGPRQQRSRVWGVESNWHEAWQIPAVQGEGIKDRDVASMARICVIGTTVKRELFGNEDPVGQHLYINNVKLEVKGVLKSRGASPMGGDFDNYIILPITTAMRRVMNVDYVGAIRIITADNALMENQAKAIRRLIHERHHITPPEEDDFRIITANIIAKMVKGTSGTLQVLLIALAALSLLVGGIVLMNIMLVSVGERTKEIGLKRAFGATRKDIFQQFMTESLTVSLIGMLLGCVLGWIASMVAVKIMKMPVVISWEPFVLAVCFTLVVGVFFGVYPARRAAKLHPVEALR
jgi:putative ABC transport system permease protein